jgi:hypothetical protein
VTLEIPMGDIFKGKTSMDMFEMTEFVPGHLN